MTQQNPKPPQPARISGPQTGWFLLLEHPAKGYSRGRFYPLQARGDFINDVIVLQELLGREFVTAFPTYGSRHPRDILILRDARDRDPSDRNRNITGIADHGEGKAAKGYTHRLDAERALLRTPNLSSWKAKLGTIWVLYGFGSRLGIVWRPKPLPKE